MGPIKRPTNNACKDVGKTYLRPVSHPVDQDGWLASAIVATREFFAVGLHMQGRFGVSDLAAIQFDKALFER
jgi:hypothetical protein